MINNLKKHWGLQSNYQLFIVILVFAITGSTSAMVTRPLMIWLGIVKIDFHFLIYFCIYFIIITPIYLILLVFFGFIFGQFHFFWAFEKRFLRKIKLGFILDLFNIR